MVFTGESQLLTAQSGEIASFVSNSRLFIYYHKWQEKKATPCKM